MGTAVRRSKNSRKTSLSNALFGQTKQRVLGLLFGQPGRSFGTVELIELADSGRGAVQRELEVLTSAGLIATETVGLQKRYRANQSSPVFDELRSIVEKTSGIGGVLRAALSPIAHRIELAVLYGSVAKHEDSASSDVDLLLVSEDLTMEDAYQAVEVAERKLGRRVSPTIYSRAEFEARRQSKQTFVAKVLSGRHVILLGTLDGDRTAR